MSDVSQGPGWWIASDGKWYPPELHPDRRADPETAEAQAAEAQAAEAQAAEAQAAEAQWSEAGGAERLVPGPISVVATSETRPAEATTPFTPVAGAQVAETQVSDTRVAETSVDGARAPTADGQAAHVLEEKSFFGSLFDFSFGSLVTMRVIRILYGLIVVLYTLGAVGAVVGLVVHPDVLRVALAVVAVPVAYVVSLTFARISLEILMVVFDIGKDVRVLRERLETGAVAVVVPEAGR